MANPVTRNIPNAITCCNLVSGCVSVALSFGGNATMAFAFIVIGATFDFLDGMAARLLGVSSAIGKELDSLADVVTFGVAPATMVLMELRVMDYPAWLEPARGVLPYTAYIIAALSGVRLAKFNLDERQAMGFIGMPTPANALFWGSLIVGATDLIESRPWMPLAMVCLVVASSALLVSEIPMFALKFKDWGWRGNHVRYTFIATSLALILALGMAAFAVIVAWYVVLSAIVNHRNKGQG